MVYFYISYNQFKDAFLKQNNMKIAVFGKLFQEKHIPNVQQLMNLFELNGAELIIFEPFWKYLQKFVNVNTDSLSFFNSSEELIGVDCVISVGGDGTMLETATFVRDSGIPVLGINTGRLGFLSSVSEGEIGKAVESILSGNYEIEERTMISLEEQNGVFGEVNFALNEITVQKKDSSSMITIHAYIDDQYFTSYWADGLIIATPTGSTAYSLSCGGPMIFPGSDNFVITPIAPHNLTVRPVVLTDKSVIRLKVEGRSDNFLVALDSRSQSMDYSVELVLKKTNFKINLIKLDNHNFIHTLRNKLMWGADKRN